MTRLRIAPSAMRMPISGVRRTGIGRDTIKTDGGQQKGQQAEQGREARNHPMRWAKQKQRTVRR